MCVCVCVCVCVYIYLCVSVCVLKCQVRFLEYSIKDERLGFSVGFSISLLIYTGEMSQLRLKAVK